MAYVIPDLYNSIPSLFFGTIHFIHVLHHLEQLTKILFTCQCCPYPLNQVVLLFYIVSLASRVSYSTIKVYWSAVRYCSNVLGYQISMACMSQYFIYFMVFTSSRVLSIVAHVSIPLLFSIFNSCSYLSVVIPLMFTTYVCCIVFSPLAFFSMLRSSEYTTVQPFLHIFQNVLYSSKTYLSP